MIKKVKSNIEEDKFNNISKPKENVVRIELKNKYGLDTAENIIDDIINKEQGDLKLGYTISNKQEYCIIILIKDPENPMHYIQPLFRKHFNKSSNHNLVQESYQFADGYYKNKLKESKSELKPIYDSLAVIYINILRNNQDYTKKEFKQNLDENYNIETLNNRIDKLENIITQKQDSKSKSSSEENNSFI